MSYDNNVYKGGGWIGSLANLLSQSSQYEVGIVYISTTRNTQTSWIKDGITYFPIYRHLGILEKIYMQILSKPCLVFNHTAVTKIINDFCPDIIQLFGLETSFGSILKGTTNVPIVVHVQGICLACCDKWFPMKLSPIKVWWYSNLCDKIKFTTSWHFYKKSKKLAELERNNYLMYKYYLGRTAWDSDMVKMLAPQSKYYVCNEVLRPEFYKRKWKPYCGGKIVLTTVTNGEIYKGFDTILCAASLLKDLNINFEWNIYGVNSHFSIKRAIEHAMKKRYADCFVHFKGKKDAIDLAIALESTTFYIHPSHIDNSPNALCEAMLVGVPCIATYVGGIPSLIEDGISGFLVGDGDTYHLVSMILKLKDDYDLLMKISQKAKNVALNRHDKFMIIENLDYIYTDILNNEAN